MRDTIELAANWIAGATVMMLLIIGAPVAILLTWEILRRLVVFWRKHMKHSGPFPLTPKPHKPTLAPAITPEEKAWHIVSTLELSGNELKPGAYEAILQFCKESAGGIGISATLEAYRKPNAVKMPWGRWVKFKPSKAP